MLGFYILELTKDCNGEVVEFMKKFNIKHSFMLTGFAFHGNYIIIQSPSTC